MRVVQELERVGDPAERAAAPRTETAFCGQETPACFLRVGWGGRGGRQKDEGGKIGGEDLIGPYAMEASGLYSVEASEKTNCMRDMFKTKQKTRRLLRL